MKNPYVLREEERRYVIFINGLYFTSTKDKEHMRYLRDLYRDQKVDVRVFTANQLAPEKLP